MQLLNRNERRDIARAFWHDHIEAYELVFRLAADRAPVDSGYVCINDPSRGELRFVFSIDDGLVLRPSVCPIGDGPTSWVIRNGKTLRDVDIKPNAFEHSRMFGARTKHSVSHVQVPLLSVIPTDDDQVVGVLSFQSYSPNAFDDAFVEWAEQVAEVIATLKVAWRTGKKHDEALGRIRRTMGTLTDTISRIEDRAAELQVKAAADPNSVAWAHEALTLVRRLSSLPLTELDRFAVHDVEAVPAQNHVLASLSAREREVANLISMPSKQIATQLGVSHHTVAFHLRAIYKKLKVTSKVEAAAQLNLWATY